MVARGSHCRTETRNWAVRECKTGTLYTPKVQPRVQIPDLPPNIHQNKWQEIYPFKYTWDRFSCKILKIKRKKFLHNRRLAVHSRNRRGQLGILITLKVLGQVSQTQYHSFSPFFFPSFCSTWLALRWERDTHYQQLCERWAVSANGTEYPGKLHPPQLLQRGRNWWSSWEAVQNIELLFFSIQFF